MANERILVINPGSTSTKVALYEGEKQLWLESIGHTLEELKDLPWPFQQRELRTKVVLDCLDKHGEKLESVDAIVSRGGCLPPVKAGAYEVNDLMVETLRDHAVDQHAANVGAAVALDLARKVGVKAYIYDALTVDEMLPVNTITGLKGVRRPARGHNLNTRAAALRVCRAQGVDYKTKNIIVAHLGGGITINLHSGGQMIDVVMDEEGTFAPERAGGIPNRALVSMCFDQGLTRVDVNKMLERAGGMISWFGTADMREVDKMIQEGNEEAALVFEAMALNTAKNIAKIAPSVDGKIDFIILTGGLAYSERFVNSVKQHVGFLAPVILVPGESEMDALSGGTLRVLRGQEQARIYEG